MAAVLPPATPSETTSATASVVSVDLASPSSATLRRNEHLAVMIARDLWKPDSEARRCDTFNCSRRFGLFERRHHCRCCGGVFCQPCSSRETELLDVSKLEFHLPPRGVPITVYASPASPVQSLRVCDGCFDSIHGRPPKILPAPAPKASSPSAPREIKPPSPASSFCSSLATPPDGQPARAPGSLKRRDSDASASSATRRRVPARSPRHSLLPSARPLTLAQVAPELAGVSCGELDAYPLRFSSAICKATGGGLWAPKPCALTAGAAAVPFPLGRPGTDSFLAPPPDEDELAEQRRRANPIIKHGEFQYRFPPQPARPPPPRYPVSTF